MQSFVKIGRLVSEKNPGQRIRQTLIIIRILHYSLAIWKINDNALSLIFFVNAQRSDMY